MTLGSQILEVLSERSRDFRSLVRDLGKPVEQIDAALRRLRAAKQLEVQAGRLAPRVRAAVARDEDVEPSPAPSAKPKSPRGVSKDPDRWKERDELLAQGKKRCATCLEPLDLGAFRKNPKRLLGTDDSCKACVNAWWRDWYTQKTAADGPARIVCARCTVEKPRRFFAKHSSGGRRSVCSRCERVGQAHELTRIRCEHIEPLQQTMRETQP